MGIFWKYYFFRSSNEWGVKAPRESFISWNTSSSMCDVGSYICIFEYMRVCSFGKRYTLTVVLNTYVYIWTYIWINLTRFLQVRYHHRLVTILVDSLLIWNTPVTETEKYCSDIPFCAVMPVQSRRLVRGSFEGMQGKEFAHSLSRPMQSWPHLTHTEQMRLSCKLRNCYWNCRFSGFSWPTPLSTFS